MTGRAWLPEPLRSVGVEYAALFRNINDVDRTRRTEAVIRALGLRDLAKAFRAELSVRRQAEETLEASDDSVGWGADQNESEAEAVGQQRPQLTDEPIRCRITAQEAWASAWAAHAPYEAASAYHPNSRAARQERLPALLLGYADQETGRQQRVAFVAFREGMKPDETIGAECGEISLASPRNFGWTSWLDSNWSFPVRHLGSGHSSDLV